MLSAIIISLGIVAVLLKSLRPDTMGRLITRTPYNNRYNDAAGAREDHIG